MSSNPPANVGSNDGLCQVEKRADLYDDVISLLKFGGPMTRAEQYAQLDRVVAAERERCAELCEGAREAASHSSDGLKRAGAMSMATSCAKLIRGPNVGNNRPDRA